ncbi:MAG: hypothetical protein ACMUIE_08195 [Thermoplasmatota archaeon]
MAFDELTELYLNCHEAVREIIKEKTGKYPIDYKKFEKERIDRFFKNIPYKGKNYLEFISILMSDLIVTHGLPNTNHRTTILFTSIILKELEIDFPYYDSVIERERWIDDCNRFIEGSKKILSKRKSNPMYNKEHLKWTRKWLTKVTDAQSLSSGMMSFHLLTSLRKIPSSEGLLSSVIK